MDLKNKLSYYRLSQEEYQEICLRLGREPKGVEWALFSALWSEHCSYKSSKIHLKKLFNQSERVLEAFGENAGVVDLGQGERVAFKMESHNHPSFIEPYQGAATGVGGILRDIFTMGARPIANANFLCFGQPHADRMSHLVDGVVRGIGGYGNCVGVPTITGQTEFDSSYDENILVNAMAVGLFRPGEGVFLSKAKGTGNWVVYVGAKTGRDGIHGASMASESFGDDSESKRPTVQIGDPFFEKCLIESCIEVMAQGLVVAIQDMGAAGLTSSTFEMASKGGVGLELHLDQVPIRDQSITAEEILLSESQERMVIICNPIHFEKLQKVFHSWGLDATKIGTVLENKKMRIHWKGDLICEIDPDVLVENAPCYERPYKKWKSQFEHKDWMSDVKSMTQESLLEQLSGVQGCSRQWVYDQYDQRVGASTVRDARNSVGVIRLPDSGRGLGIVLGCRPYVMRFDAQVGGIDSIIYPALELASKGFEPLAVTDCLNFGNPEKEETMTEFVAALEGMNEACEKINAPIISGNVSFYNETYHKNVTSTPATGLIGLNPEISKLPNDYFVKENDLIYVLTLNQLEFGGLSEDLLKKESIKGSGKLNETQLALLVQFVKELARTTLLTSTRLVGKFGVPYALARMTLNGMGCEVNGIESRGWLRGERLYQIIFTVSKDKEENLKDWLSKNSLQKGLDNLAIDLIGKVIPSRFKIDCSWDLSVEEIKHAYTKGWRTVFENLE